jgi:hypothetical protein
MDRRVQKLARLLKDRKLAEDLVKAGLDTPKKLKSATDQQIVRAVGAKNKDAVRKRFRT